MPLARLGRAKLRSLPELECRTLPLPVEGTLSTSSGAPGPSEAAPKRARPDLMDPRHGNPGLAPPTAKREGGGLKAFKNARGALRSAVTKLAIVAWLVLFLWPWFRDVPAALTILWDALMIVGGSFAWLYRKTAKGAHKAPRRM